MEEPVRVDKWLWAARFFKTRSLARDAVAGGKVQLNGYRVKPGRALRVGDELRIQRGEEEYSVEVLQLTTRRGPGAVAQTLYAESRQSAERRERLAAERRLERQQRAGPERRPDKRQRRRIIRFKNTYD